MLQSFDFDVTIQNTFNDSLFDFGWGRTEKMYSEYFNKNKQRNILLNHTKHMRKDGENGYRHHNHLHLTGFDDNRVKVIIK